MEVEAGSRCIYQIRYPRVMCVKYRKQLLAGREGGEGIGKIFREVGERYWYRIQEVGTDGDHVHVFVGAAGRWAPSRIMQVLKSIRAREMFRQFPAIRKQLWGGEFGSDGGYIGTVGDGTTEEVVRKYIEQQGSSREKAL